MTPARVVIVGGPSRGKSTEAHLWHLKGYPIHCGDPASTVVYQKPYTNYLPESLPFAGEGGAAHWVARRWFTMAGPWVCEGHVMARALRRWIGERTAFGQPFPCDLIIVLDKPAHRATTPQQEGMHKGVMKVWREIAPYYAPITEHRKD